MAFSEVIKQNWVAVQEMNVGPVNVVGEKIRKDDEKTLKIWQEEDVDKFLKKVRKQTMASKLVMIVEDSRTDMRIAETICVENGYKTVTVTEGDKALSMAIEQKPELILLDVILPNKNGFQVCRQLKTNEKTKDIKIVIVSSKDQASDKFWARKQGADDYITKPYEEDDLLAAIAKNI